MSIQRNERSSGLVNPVNTGEPGSIEFEHEAGGTHFTLPSEETTSNSPLTPSAPHEAKADEKDDKIEDADVSRVVRERKGAA